MDSDQRKPPRILIVEDEPTLALAVEETLAAAGFEIAGVVGRRDKALALVESAGFDAAIVDANLNGISAAPVAAALTARGLPFIVMSGYSPRQQPDALRAAPLIQKPCRPERLVEALKNVLSKQ
jgi:DNA-binding response OmpR family regulator